LSLDLQHCSSAPAYPWKRHWYRVHSRASKHTLIFLLLDIDHSRSKMQCSCRHNWTMFGWLLLLLAVLASGTTTTTVTGFVTLNRHGGPSSTPFKTMHSGKATAGSNNALQQQPLSLLLHRSEASSSALGRRYVMAGLLAYACWTPVIVTLHVIWRRLITHTVIWCARFW
jgi:hypothetical protein